MRNNVFFPSLLDQSLSPLFEDFFATPLAGSKNKSLFNLPSVNILDQDNQYIIEVAAPGLHKNDFTLKVEKDVLTVSVQREKSEETKEENYTRKEFNYTSFKRSFHLGNEIKSDAITASYDDGILKIALPKNEEVVSNKVKTIEIG